MPICECVNVQITVKKSHFNPYEKIKFHPHVPASAHLHIRRESLSLSKFLNLRE
jgi:hypothetical protein